MTNDERLARDVTRYIDGLMSPAEEQAFRQRVEQDPSLKAELAAQEKMKEVTDGMSLAQVPDEIWDGYWKDIYRRIERGAGWFFLSAGLIVLLAVGVYHLFADFLFETKIPILIRVGVGAGSLGVIILLVSIGRERYFARTHERYDGVER